MRGFRNTPRLPAQMTEYHPTYRPDLLARIPKNEAQKQEMALRGDLLPEIPKNEVRVQRHRTAN